VEKDLTKTLHWYEQAADLHDPAATRALGTMYATGTGVPVDDAEAFRLLLKAAQLGDLKAMKDVAIRYEHGLRYAFGFNALSILIWRTR
jgi:uncharacterized protein